MPNSQENTQAQFVQVLLECELLQPGHVSGEEKVKKLIGMISTYTGGDADLAEPLRQVMNDHSNMKESDKKQIIKRFKLQAKLGCIPKSHLEYVSAYCKKNSIEMTLDGRLFLNNDLVDVDLTYSEMLLFAADVGEFCSDNLLGHAWKVWQGEQRDIACRKLQEKIKFTEKHDGLWNEIYGALIDVNTSHLFGLSDGEYLTCAIAIQKGFIWRVKNKLAGNPVYQHIMPYYRGPQGCGKTTYLRWLLAPVEDATTSTNFEIFAHDGRMMALSRSYIVFFDEMARLQKADADIIKNIMTAETSEFRKLHHESAKRAVVSTFIGAGNNDLSLILNDQTGSRRFFQIEVLGELNNINSKLISTTDSLLLWQSVDENATDPILAIVPLLKKIQSSQHNKGPVGNFLDFIIENKLFDEWVDVQEIWDRFKSWRNMNAEHDKTTEHGFKTRFGQLYRDDNREETAQSSRQSPSNRSRRRQYCFTYPCDAIDEDTNAALHQALKEASPHRPLH